MTDIQGQPETSAFNQRSDDAANRLRGQLSQEQSARTGQSVDLPSSPVPVNDHGQPVGQQQLPPEGSYAMQELEQQHAAGAQQQALMQHQQATDPASQQPPAPMAPVQAPPQEPPEPVSQRAETRIADLVSKLRQKDQDYQQLQQLDSSKATTVEELNAQLQASQNQMASMMEQHMESLPEEVQMQIRTDARVNQALANSEQRILQTVAPQLEALQTRNDQLEKVSLGSVYDGYDPLTHDPLIDEFRRVNRKCSIKQAFQAVATPEELSVRGVRPANAPPPAVPPGNGPITPRYLPQQGSQVTPIEQMEIDGVEAARLARSVDPEDQKAAAALWQKHLTDKLEFNKPAQR